MSLIGLDIGGTCAKLAYRIRLPKDDAWINSFEEIKLGFKVLKSNDVSELIAFIRKREL